MKGTAPDIGLAKPCPKSPPDGIESDLWAVLTDSVRAGWETLSDDDRRHVLAAARAGLDRTEPTYAQRVAALEAKVDPAVSAALDELIAADSESVRVIRREVDTGYSDTEPECPNQIARTRTVAEGDEWTTEVVMLDCERRACTVCGPRWAHTWAMNIHANFADEATVIVAEIADTEWPTLHKTIKRNSTDDDRYVRIPTAADSALVVTTTPIDRGRAMSPSDAIRATESALTAVSHRAKVDRRRVTTSRNFVKAAEIRNTDTDDEAVYGQLTRVDPQNPGESLARIARDDVALVAVVRDADDDPTTTRHWRLRGSPLAMQLVLARGGHMTDAEREIDRERRRFEDFVREQQRRRPTGIERRAVA